MEQNPYWEANLFSTSKDILRVLWKPKVHYRIHKCQPLVSILNQFNPVHTLTSWMFVLILSSHLCLVLPSSYFHQVFQPKNLYTPLLSTIHATFPLNIILIDFISRKLLGEKYRSLNSSWCSFLYSLFTSSLLGQNILVNALFSNTLNLNSYFNVSNQVSHTYKTTGTFIVLCILIFKFLDNKLEDKRFCTKL